mgnify:FL=1|jgi:hypothetical protein
MPIYTFENNGRCIEQIAPMGTESIVHEGRRWKRQPVACFGVTGFAREAELKDHVKRGFSRLEDRQGSRFESTFTKNQIRKIWDI